MGNTFTMQLNYAGGHGVNLPFNIRYNDLRPQFFGPAGSYTAGQAGYSSATAAAYTALIAQVANPCYGAAGVASGTLTKNTVQQVQLDARFPQYTSGAISGIQNSSANVSYQDIGSTGYNSLQATLQIHRPGGVSGSVSYVWSHPIGNVSDHTDGFLNTTGTLPTRTSTS